MFHVERHGPFHRSRFALRPEQFHVERPETRRWAAGPAFARDQWTASLPVFHVERHVRPHGATPRHPGRRFTWNGIVPSPSEPRPATRGIGFTWNRQKPGVSAADSTSRRGEWVGSLPVFHVERHGGAGHRGATARHAKSRFKGYGPRPGATAADSNEVVRRTACGI